MRTPIFFMSKVIQNSEISPNDLLYSSFVLPLPSLPIPSPELVFLLFLTPLRSFWTLHLPPHFMDKFYGDLGEQGKDGTR